MIELGGERRAAQQFVADNEQRYRAERSWLDANWPEALEQLRAAILLLQAAVPDSAGHLAMLVGRVRGMTDGLVERLSFIARYESAKQMLQRRGVGDDRKPDLAVGL